MDVPVCCCARWIVQVLKAKQGSSQQYSSQAERDTHLKKHIKQLKQAAAGQQEQLQTLKQQEEELGTALTDLASVSDVHHAQHSHDDPIRTPPLHQLVHDS